jgi:hypothetical protein
MGNDLSKSLDNKDRTQLENCIPIGQYIYRYSYHSMNLRLPDMTPYEMIFRCCEFDVLVI